MIVALRHTATIINRIILKKGNPLQVGETKEPECKQKKLNPFYNQSHKHPTEQQTVLARFRLPRQLPSLTLLYSQFPMEEHAERPDVPALTDVHVEHLRPKKATHPWIQSPRSIIASAVLASGVR